MKKQSLFLSLLAAATLCLSACSTPFFNGSPASNTSSGQVVATPDQPSAAEQKPEEEKYLKADRNPPKIRELKKECVQADGHEVCGYDCKVAGHNAQCADQPKARCVVGPNHEVVCGFDCKVTSTHADCGKYLYSNCVTNAAGEIKCGNNCQERDDGQLVCGK